MTLALEPVAPRVPAVRHRWRHRARQTRRLLHDEGWQGVARRATRSMVTRLPVDLTEPLPVRHRDLVAADVTRTREFRWRRVPAGTPLWINVVTTPPNRYSGGHTTLMRIIAGLERGGHRVRIFLDDVHASDANWYAPRIRDWFPEVRASVHDAHDGMGDADAVIATAWPSAYRAFNDPCAGKRFYLVQDYEPWFHPPGAQASFAESTYRMGFHALTAGAWLADLLRDRFQISADSFDFGVGSQYGLERAHQRPLPTRDAVVFHVRRDTPRRAFELGAVALEVFHRWRPQIPLITFGGAGGLEGVDTEDLGMLVPEELNAIYQRARAGLSLSFTNTSLIPLEMLAAGCVPVINDAPQHHIVLANDHIRYAPADPHSIARALVDVVDATADPVAVSASVTGRDWSEAGHVVRTVMERELWQ